jgi:hypothetical protein
MFVESGGSPGSQVEVNQGARALLHSDGESIEEFIRDIYDVGFFIGDYVEGAVGGAFVAPRNFTLPANLTGSQAYAFTAPGEGLVISIQKNEGEVGTMSIAAGANAGTFSFASAVSFVAGDRLGLVNGTSSPEETVAGNIAISLKASLS